MPYVIKLLCMADGQSTIVCTGAQGRQSTEGAYIKEFDADAFGGRGRLVITQFQERAISFGTPAAAMEYWRRQSTVTPLRPDGEPNRPLTAFTVEIAPL